MAKAHHSERNESAPKAAWGWLTWIRRLLNRCLERKAKRAPAFALLGMESLEGRDLMAVDFSAAIPASVLEDAGLVSLSGWASVTTDDPADQDFVVFEVANVTEPGSLSQAPTVDSNGDLTFQFADDAAGTVSFDVRVTVGAGAPNAGQASAWQTFTIEATPVNDMPVPTRPDYITIGKEEDWSRPFLSLPALYGPGGGSDESQQDLLIQFNDYSAYGGGIALFHPDQTTMVQSGEQFSLAQFSSLWLWKDPNVGGAQFINVMVQDDGGTADGGGDTVWDSIWLDVWPGNDPPYASTWPSSLWIDNEAFEYDLSVGLDDVIFYPGQDPDESGQSVSFIITSVPDIAIGTLYWENGTAVEPWGPEVTWPEILGMQFRPTGVAGSTAIAFDVHDSGGWGTYGGSYYGLSLDVVDINTAPVVGDDILADIGWDAPAFEIPFSLLLANDSPGDWETGQSLSIFAAGDSYGGSLELLIDSVRFTPESGYVGAAGFTYTVVDDGTEAGGQSAPAYGAGFVQFNITPGGLLLEATDPPSVLEDQGAIVILNWASVSVDDPGDAPYVSFEVTNISDPALFAELPAVSAAGTLSYRFANDVSGSATFDVRAVIGIGAPNAGAVSNWQSMAVSSLAVNDPPALGNDSLASIVEDSAPIEILWSTLLANDSPGAGEEGAQSLVVTGLSNAIGGAVELLSDRVRFTPTANFNGTASFNYTVIESGVASPLSAAASVSFAVSPVNDLPALGNDSLASIVEDTAPIEILWSTLLANDSPGAGEEGTQSLVVTTLSNAIEVLEMADGVMRGFRKHDQKPLHYRREA